MAVLGIDHNTLEDVHHHPGGFFVWGAVSESRETMKVQQNNLANRIDNGKRVKTLRTNVRSLVMNTGEIRSGVTPSVYYLGTSEFIALTSPLLMT